MGMRFIPSPPVTPRYQATPVPGNSVNVPGTHLPFFDSFSAACNKLIPSSFKYLNRFTNTESPLNPVFALGEYVADAT
jgi:hypothetical protein